jgi:hypothetical protein
MRALGAMLFALLLAPAVARADSYAQLGVLERAAVDAAIAQRGLAIEPAPDGKIVGGIHVLNLDVFQPDDGGLLEWFNHFHRTTREESIRRESLLLPGMAYDTALVDETMRNLRNHTLYSASDPPLTSIVAIVPVQTAAPGTVDVFIVTRDVWSLRFNSDWNYQPGYLINLNASLSENNLFGWRKQAALALSLNPGDLWVGPNYLDPNVLGTHLRLIATFYEIWARRIGDIAAGPREGSSSRVRVEYPLYALSQRWGGFVDGSYTSRVWRAIYGNNLTYFNPNAGPNASSCLAPGQTGFASVDQDAPCAFRLRTGALTSGLTRSFQRSWLIQRITVGNEFGLTRPELLPSFATDPAIQASFKSTYFNISERTSWLYLQYDAFTPRYLTYRNLDSYDLGEDQRLGPWLTLKLGRASTLLGSENDFFIFRAESHINANLLGGFQSIGAAWETREYSYGLRDQLFTGQFLAYTPVLARTFRVVVSSNAGFMADNVHRSLVYVGALQGLRGYPVDWFGGYDFYLAHLEIRSMAISIASLRLGGLIFADAGDAANSPGDLQFFGDVGGGLRLLIPQLNADVLRCDWAFPLRDAGAVRVGWPGRLSIGFRQVF